jgi:hypothetical protein
MFVFVLNFMVLWPHLRRRPWRNFEISKNKIRGRSGKFRIRQTHFQLALIHGYTFSEVRLDCMQTGVV